MSLAPEYSDAEISTDGKGRVGRRSGYGSKAHAHSRLGGSPGTFSPTGVTRRAYLVTVVGMTGQAHAAERERSRLESDTARGGHSDLKCWTEVVAHLDAARMLAPQWSRLQPLGRTALGQLVEHRGRRSQRIAVLAEHYGT